MWNKVYNQCSELVTWQTYVKPDLLAFIFDSVTTVL